ncbi:TPA: hypothetical protein DDZ01_02460 [Candidatus Uhrbacteria bacterium]|nr:MAG: hypothetical protein UT94_C0061G0004 [Candidatus Uhrbacteria bacterium GW2011_GWF2_40_263]HBK34832.1 hypothetical protein [Candidatus Uhrbacteria bacterium]HCB56220.1 hypothetical protein [Candidatus Uhrbacteria bacterium]
MSEIISVIFIGLHVFLAWLLIEVFVNVFHGLKRSWFIVWHYFVVFLSFIGMFFLYFSFFTLFPVFTVMVVAMLFLLLLELFVFRYMYSGELWFLNYVDWIAPVFIAISSIYLAGAIVM